MKRQSLATFAASVLVAWSCGGNRGPLAPAGQTRTEIRLTDAPLTAAGIRSVNVYIDRVDASETSDTGSNANLQPFTTLVAPHQRYDLLTLQNGATALLGTAQLTPTVYRAVRVVLNTDSSSIVRTDGSLAPVQWGYQGPISLHTTLDAPVQVSGSSVRVLLDFNVANSFVPDPQNANGFVFLPWIHVTLASN